MFSSCEGIENWFWGRSWECWVGIGGGLIGGWLSVLRRASDLSRDLLRLKSDVLGAVESEVLEEFWGTQDGILDFGGGVS